ncbi:amidohydrolase family protein [Sphingomonas sp. 2R-10]|uniref:amidohydrolase family protein n=1 Tax=Sphingomonas sp. 2R-10 TaxID=3045148 RepID=UPI000F7683AD|nr:amidohydrolase family protein [Sphingomonas sp. 2R-10]MDJ0278685.1 amidohydrolase family protein [Sphingomonas sp. 2R-10]
MADIIDAHLHVWRIDAPFHGWPEVADGGLYRSHSLDDARAAMGDAPVGRVVLVQAQTDDRETDWMLDLAEADPWVAGVVGWVALDDPGAPARIAALAQRPKLLGLRPMLQAIPESDWLLRDDVARGVAAMFAGGLRFDALVQPRHLDVLATFADRWPTLPIVIDHAAKPTPPGDAGWATGMAALATRPNVWCKLSGLRTEQAAGDDPLALGGIVERVLGWFGERVLWGSDWPVLSAAGDGYSDWLATTRALTAGLSDDARVRLMGGAARAFYGV